MTLLPRTKLMSITPTSHKVLQTATEETVPEHEVLLTSTTGAIFVLSPLTEAEYRRLTTLANHLSNVLHHPCGLNPKAYRISTRAPEAVLGGRPIVDGTIAMRWMDLGSQRRAEVAGRVGVNADVIRDDLETLMGGLEYL
jgi:cleavage and polyadenylation specificity factor subunit 1